MLGNLTRDPELRTTSNNKTVCSFGLAVNRQRKADGQPDADFFNVSAWGQLGENCAKYLTKGRKVCLWGAVQIRAYEDRDGNKRTAVDVMADNVEFLGGKEDRKEQAPRPDPNGFTQVDDEEMPF